MMFTDDCKLFSLSTLFTLMVDKIHDWFLAYPQAMETLTLLNDYCY